MKKKNIETRFAERTHSYFSAFGTIVSNFYLEVGIYFVGAFNATIVAWNIYTQLLDDGQPMPYAVLLGLVTLIAVEGLAVYLVTAAAKTKNAWLWFFSILFACFFTFAHMQEMEQPGVIGQYVTLGIPFFIVVGYWARTVKLEADTATKFLQHTEEESRKREIQIADEDRARKLQLEDDERVRKQQIEDDERRHKQQMTIDTKEKNYKLNIAKLQSDHVKVDDVNIMSKRSQSHVNHEVIDINLGRTNDQKRLSKIENLDKLRQLLEEDPDRPVIQLARLLNVNRQTIYNYKRELESNGAVK